GSFVLASSPVYAFTPNSGIPSSTGPLSAVSTFVGSGDFNDAAEQSAVLEAAFRFPVQLAAMPDGSLLIADSANHLIRKIKDGIATVYAGFLLSPKDLSGMPAGVLLDGAANASSFNQPASLAVDEQGNVYVADAGNHAIRKIDTEGNVTTIAGNGKAG